MKCEIEARELEYEGTAQSSDGSVRSLTPGAKFIIGLVGVQDHVEYDHVGPRR